MLTLNIASITGKDYKTVIKTLQGSIYQNPVKWGECFFKGWETSEEYLSGNVRHKLKVAIKENEQYNGYFKKNVSALKKALPISVPVLWIINNENVTPPWGKITRIAVNK